MPPIKPYPVIDDPDTAGFYRAAQEGKLALEYCGTCGALKHLPRDYCNRCGAWNNDWREVAPYGRVYSYTIVEHQASVSFDVPYTLVLIELEDEPAARLIGHLDGRPPIEVGTRLQAVFDEQRGDATIPRWTVADGA